MTPHDSDSRMKIKKSAKESDDGICVVVLCAASFVCALFARALSVSLSLFLSLFQSFFICLSLSASAIMAMLVSQSTWQITSPQCSTEAETEFKSRKHARVSVSQS